MANKLLELTDTDFDGQVLTSPLPVLVDFWATWCPPCIAMSRTLEDLAPAYEGKVKIVKVNVEVAVDVGVRYGVRGLPNITIIKNGEVIDTRIGNQSRGQLDALLSKIAS